MFENLSIPYSINDQTYIPRKKLGEGRTGAIYLSYNVEDMDQQHPLAIRFPTIISSSKQRSNLIAHQASLLQQLTSPYVPKYIDHSEHPICPYLVLEFITETLSDRITKNTLTQELFIQYLRQIPTILNFLQQKNKVHGDLKCANLGNSNNSLKILDLEDMHEPKSYRIPENAPLYYPPEFRFYGTLTLQSDTYTAGRNLEYMLTAQHADTTQDTFETIELIHNLSLPNSFKEVYTSMTNRNPNSRPTPSQLTTVLQQLIEDILSQNIFHPMQLIDIELPEWF